MKNFFSITLVTALLFIACNRIKEGTKNAVDKTAETAGKVGSDVVNKVGEGVKQSLQGTVVISEALKNDGLSFGKMDFSSQKNTTDNVLNIYLIFANDFAKTLNIKVFDESGLEYGRTNLAIKAKKGTAGYYNFVFDTRVNLEAKSKFVVE